MAIVFRNHVQFQGYYLHYHSQPRSARKNTIGFEGTQLFFPGLLANAWLHCKPGLSETKMVYSQTRSKFRIDSKFAEIEDLKEQDRNSK